MGLFEVDTPTSLVLESREARHNGNKYKSLRVERTRVLREVQRGVCGVSRATPVPKLCRWCGGEKCGRAGFQCHFVRGSDASKLLDFVSSAWFGRMNERVYSVVETGGGRRDASRSTPKPAYITPMFPITLDARPPTKVTRTHYHFEKLGKIPQTIYLLRAQTSS